MPPSSVSVALGSHSKRKHFGIWPTAIKLNTSGKTEVIKSDWIKSWYTYIYNIYLPIYLPIYIYIYIYIFIATKHYGETDIKVLEGVIHSIFYHSMVSIVG